MASALSYASISPKFALYHQNSSNAAAHVLTLALGLLGVAGLIIRGAVALSRDETGRHARARALAAAAWLGYALAIAALDVPRDLALYSACVCFTVALAAARMDNGCVTSALMIAASYVLQDVAHWYWGEETYQQNTWGKGGVTLEAAGALFLEQCIFLLPLALERCSQAVRVSAALSPLALWAWGNLAVDSDSAGWRGLPFVARKTRLLVGKFTAPRDVADLETCRAWCVARGPKPDMTSHWWMTDLDPAARAAFERLATSKCVEDLFRSKFAKDGYELEPVWGMNELYVSAPVKREGAKTSDDVFFTEHVDGPYCVLPFASVFRCIVALDSNVPGYATHFPNAHRSVAAEHGDILAFDFHRECHYITMKPSGAFGPENARALAADPTQKWRMVLKLHYAVAPTGVWWCWGRLVHWLSTKYNEAFRALFLATIAPKSAFEKFVADLGVNGTTIAYNAVEKYAGFGNVLFYAVLGVFSYATDSYNLFLYATQFLHYGRYISTYYVREGVAFGTFKRDVLLYKSIALAQLFGLFLMPLATESPHCAETKCFRAAPILLTALGYFISVAATAALGVDGTYFGIELGVVKADYKFVTQFPYNVLPHPMILGQVGALIGLHLAPQISGPHPYLCLVHVALYLAHMTQEAFDVHAGTPWYKQKKHAGKSNKAIDAVTPRRSARLAKKTA